MYNSANDENSEDCFFRVQKFTRKDDENLPTTYSTARFSKCRAWRYYFP